VSGTPQSRSFLITGALGVIGVGPRAACWRVATGSSPSTSAATVTAWRAGSTVAIRYAEDFGVSSIGLRPAGRD
jgi:hypothetical protein